MVPGRDGNGCRRLGHTFLVLLVLFGWMMFTQCVRDAVLSAGPGEVDLGHARSANGTSTCNHCQCYRTKPPAVAPYGPGASRRVQALKTGKIMPSGQQNALNRKPGAIEICHSNHCTRSSGAVKMSIVMVTSTFRNMLT
jgi:hypothetical protein